MGTRPKLIRLTSGAQIVTLSDVDQIIHGRPGSIGRAKAGAERALVSALTS